MAIETRAVTVTFDDGSTHVYQNVPKTATPEQVETRAMNDFKGKKVKSLEGGAKATSEVSFGTKAKEYAKDVARKVPALSFLVPEQEGGRDLLKTVTGVDTKGKSTGTVAADVLQNQLKAATPSGDLGEGPPQRMTPAERLRRLAAAGTEGVAIGSAAGYLAPEFGGPVVGGALGGTGGVLAEGAEQGLSAIGAPRYAQVLGGLVTGVLAPELAVRAPKAALKLATGNIGGAAKSALLSQTEREGLEATGIKAAREQQRQTALDELMHGRTTMESSTAVGKGLRTAADEAEAADILKLKQQTGVADAEYMKRKAELEAKLQQRKDRADAIAAQRAKGENAGLTAARRQNETAQNDLTRIVSEGTGEQVHPHQLGSEIRSSIEEVRDPAYKAMKDEYAADYEAAMSKAREAEKKGDFWSTSKGAKDVVFKWSKKMFGLTNEEKTFIASQLKNLVRTKDPLSAEGVDNFIRRLGDKGYVDAEGAGAINPAMARELRNDIIHGVDGKGGGFYDWSGLGNAKTKYAQSLENLQTYETNRASQATETQGQTNIYKEDAKTLPDTFFKSHEGVEQLTNQLGGNVEKVQKLAQQYTHNQLKGKDAQAIAKWAQENPQLMEIGGVRDIVDTQYTRVDRAVGRVEQTQAALAEAKPGSGFGAKVEKKKAEWEGKTKEEIAALEKQTGEQKKQWSTSVDNAAKQRVKELGLESGGMPVNPREIVGNILDSKQSDAMLRAVSKHANDNPAIRSEFPDAVAGWASEKSPAALGKVWPKALESLKGSGIIDSANLSKLDAQVTKLINSAKYMPPEQAKKTLQDGIKDAILKYAIRGAVVQKSAEDANKGGDRSGDRTTPTIQLNTPYPSEM